MQTQRRIVRRHRVRVNTDPRDPRAVGTCMGCGLETPRHAMREQMAYRGGSTPVPTGVWKCQRCIDELQPYYKRQRLKPDPVPVDKPFPDDNGSDGETFPSYASVGALPSAASLPAGYMVDVTIDSVSTRAYSDTVNWRKYSDNSVIS